MLTISTTPKPLADHDVFAALADPTRRAIFESLCAAPRAVGELADQLPVSRPAVSQHLRVLERAGLVEMERAGTRRIYSANRAGLEALRSWLDRQWDTVLDHFRRTAERVRPSPPTPSTSETPPT